MKHYLGMRLSGGIVGRFASPITESEFQEVQSATMPLGFFHQGFTADEMKFQTSRVRVFENLPRITRHRGGELVLADPMQCFRMAVDGDD